MFLSPQMPRPHRGSLYHRSPRRRRRREVTTVAQQLGSKAAWCDAAAPSPALWIRRGQRPEGDAGASLRDRTPRTTRLSRFIQCSPAAASRAHHIGFRLSPALAFSVPSQPLRSDVLAQRFSDSSVHTRTERACSSHFPEFNSQPVEQEAEATATSVAAAAAAATVVFAFLASWRLPGADKRRERERARGRGDDDSSLLLARAALAVGASIMN